MKQTKESNTPTSAMLFCSVTSVVALHSFYRRDKRGSIGLRGLQEVRRCTRSEIYQEEVLLGCFKRASDGSYNRYSIYGGPPHAFSNAILARGTLDTIIHTNRGVTINAYVRVLENVRAPTVAEGRCGRLGAFNINGSMDIHS